jgi:hypothetical protein
VTLWALIGIPLLLVALFLTPLGLPGNWIMIAVLAAATFYGEVGIAMLVATTTIAFVGEGIEFLIVKRFNVKYGGSNRAFWGALAGGLLGTLIGLPVPVIGSIVAGVLGTFVGAVLVTFAEARTVGTAARVGWGVALGRMWSAAAKTAAGFTILVLGAWALLA